MNINLVNHHKKTMLTSCSKQCRRLFNKKTFSQYYHNIYRRNSSELTQIEWFNSCQEDSITFWKEAAKGIEWEKFPEIIYKPHDYNNQLGYSWFSDGKLNITISMIDRWIKQGYGNNNAIIYDSPVTKQIKYITFNQLLDNVENCASYLRQHCNIKKGDVILIYMPMIPEALISMYACARVGGIHGVVFGGFAAPELAKRIIDCKPKIIITASGGKENENKIIEYGPILENAIDLVPNDCKPNHILIKQRENIGIKPNIKSIETNDWDEMIENNKYDKSLYGYPEIMNSTDPLYILYTSGTTGSPKGIVRDIGGYGTMLNWTMKNFYNGNQGKDCVGFMSDIGWVVGHSYIAYSQLLNGVTTILFEGKPVGISPDGPGTFWRLVEQHNIKSLFTAPTALRAIRKEDPYGEYIKKYNISSLKNLFLAGERCDPSTMTWIDQLLKDNKTFVTDHYWQTETGYPITGVMLGDNIVNKPNSSDISLGSAGLPIPGMMLNIVPQFIEDDENDEKTSSKSMPIGKITPVDIDCIGELVLKLPLPPGTLSGIWNNPKRTFEAYLEKFPGYYSTGDVGFKDKNGYIHVMSRVDDIINVSGHRLSTASMEQVIAEHECIAECAVIGVHHSLKGQVPVGVVVKKQGKQFETIHSEIIEEEIKLKIRSDIGAVASYSETIIVDKLPKTRSGKILRRSLKDIYNTEQITNIPATIEDADALNHFQNILLEYRKRKTFSQM